MVEFQQPRPAVRAFKGIREFESLKVLDLARNVRRLKADVEFPPDGIAVRQRRKGFEEAYEHPVPVDGRMPVKAPVERRVQLPRREHRIGRGFGTVAGLIRIFLVQAPQRHLGQACGRVRGQFRTGGLLRVHQQEDQRHDAQRRHNTMVDCPA